MEIALARSILNLSENELVSILMSLKLDDFNAYQLLKEKVEEII